MVCLVYVDLAAFDSALQVNLFLALTVSLIYSNLLANVSNTLMAHDKIKYAKEMLLSLRFWWKNSTTNVGRSTALCYRSVGFCHQALRTQPLAETTWNALKEKELAVPEGERRKQTGN